MTSSLSHSHRSMNKLFLIVFLLVLIIIAGGFYFVFILKKIQKPSISSGNSRLTQVTFESIDLAFDVTIENPNKLSLTIRGFDYELIMDGKSVLTGKQEKSITLVEKGKTTIEIPVNLQFQKIYSVVQSVQDKKEIPLQTKITVGIELPAWGKVKIPIEPPSLSIPMIQIPLVKNVELKKKSVNILKGAELELILQLENPNDLPLELKQFTYTFSVSQNAWVKGQESKGIPFKKGDQNFLTIPMNINLMSMGGTAKDLIMGGKALDYVLEAELEFKTTLPSVPILRWKINKSGQTTIH